VLICVLYPFSSPACLLSVCCLQSRRPQAVQPGQFSYKLQSRPTGLVWVLLLEVSHRWVWNLYFYFSFWLFSDFLPYTAFSLVVPQVHYQSLSMTWDQNKGDFFPYLYTIKALQVTFVCYLSSDRLSKDRLIMRLGCSYVLLV
jgi:hypothetical protein